MRKTLFCGVDLHSNNAMYVITDGRDKQLLQEAIAERVAGGPGVAGALPRAAQGRGGRVDVQLVLAGGRINGS